MQFTRQTSLPLHCRVILRLTVDLLHIKPRDDWISSWDSPERVQLFLVQHRPYSCGLSIARRAGSLFTDAFMGARFTLRICKQERRRRRILIRFKMIQLGAPG